MKNWLLGLSVLLNLVLLGVLVFLNERYGLWAKVQRVALVEGRVPGVAASYELNREYQVRREMFRLDKNESARVLMLGDSLTAQGEWNAMLGEPLVANRGIDGDTSAGVLARIGDDADFRGDAVVIWIGTNDVLQGGAAGPVAERIMEAARGKAEHPRDSAEPKGKTNVWPREGNRSEAEQNLKSEKLKKKNLTTKNTNRHEIGKIIDGKIIGITEGEAGPRLAGQAGASESDSLASELADSPVSESLISSADGPAGARIAPEDRRLKIEDRGAAEPPRTEGGPVEYASHSTGERGRRTEETTDDSDKHGWGGAGERLDKPSGASESDSLASELADSPVSESLTRSASGPAGARIAPGEMGSGGGNQLADSGEFLEGQSQAGLQMGSQKLHSPRVATESDTSGKNSSSVSISVISGKKNSTAPEAQIFVLGVAPLARWWEGARERNAVIREINARLAEGAGENGYRFIELESVLADENGFLRRELTSDGVHLSAKGYVEVIQRLKEVGLWPAAED